MSPSTRTWTSSVVIEAKRAADAARYDRSCAKRLEAGLRVIAGMLKSGPTGYSVPGV